MFVPNQTENLKDKVSINCYGKSKTWALRKLQDFGIDAFFRKGILIIQKPTNLEAPDKPKTFGTNFNIIEDNLILRANRPIQVELKSYNPQTGTYAKAKAGDPKGELKTFEIDGISPAQIEQRAKEIYIEIAGPGMRGDFTTFGYPPVYHSDIVHIIDPEEQDKNKLCFVTAVEKHFDCVNAKFRQKVSLDIIKFNSKNFNELPAKFKTKVSASA